MDKQEQKEIDKETQRINHEGEELKAMTKSEGWSLAKGKMLGKIADLLNLSSVDVQNADAATIIQVIGAKKMAADILLSFIREVEGDVAQHEGNKDMMKSVEEIFIIRQSNN